MLRTSQQPILISETTISMYYLVVLKEILLYLGLSQETTLQSLGLSLSGCEVEETNKELGEKLMKLHPKLVKEVPQVCSDTVGSLLTASEKAKLSIPSTTNNMLMLWHTKWVLCALAYFDGKKVHYKANVNSQLFSADPTM